MKNKCSVDVGSWMGPRRYLRNAALVFLLVSGVAGGAVRSRALARAMAATANPGQPTITVLPAATGASLQSYSAGSASLAFGRASYYGRTLAPGVTARKNSTSMVLSSRFGLQVTCSGTSGSSLAEVTISLTGMDPSYTVSVDGARLASGSSVSVLRCGSVTEHVVEVEVPKSRPAGVIGGTLSFSAMSKN